MMPKIVNGHSSMPPIQEDAKNYELTLKLLNEIRMFWVQQQAAFVGEDPIKVTRLATVAFSQWAAILAVDVGMQQDQFTAVCRANFDQAFQKAPRFS